MAKKNQTSINYPRARDENVVVEAVGDETVIYDLDTHVAHALKPLAAAVYMYADGKNTVSEIAELASYRLETTVTEADAEDALAQLESISMLSTPVLDINTGISRRTALKTFAAAGAGSMLVLSIATSAAGACYLCSGAPSYVNNYSADPTKVPANQGVACTMNALPSPASFGDAPGPGDCQLCQPAPGSKTSTAAVCGSGTACCCTPCDNDLSGANGAAYCCQPVCMLQDSSNYFSNGYCPAYTLPLNVSAKTGDIYCPTNYYQYNKSPYNTTVKCCAYEAVNSQGQKYTSPFCENPDLATGVC